MSKSSILDNNVKTYIINSFDFSDYDVEPVTVQEKIEFVKNEFESSMKWNIDRLGHQKALSEWLSGLPSCLNIAFNYCDILDLAVEWDSIPENYTDKQADKITDNYWNFMANKLGQLFRGYRLPKEVE